MLSEKYICHKIGGFPLMHYSEIPKQAVYDT